MTAARLRLAFMGSPDFAVPALQALASAGHDIAAVYCQPPRPAGRGQAETPCAVHAAAARLGLRVRHPATLRGDPAVQDDFAALKLDVAVVAAYGLILPQPMLDAPRRGCLNIHASLLPRWRGAAPIQAAILAGDVQSGVTIMRMEAGLDTGPMLLADATGIDDATTSPVLHDILAMLGARLILRALDEDPPQRPQPGGATYAPKLSRADTTIDWSLPAMTLGRRVRALIPWPGSQTRLAGIPLKIHAAAVADGSGPPGTTLDARLTVACGTGALRLLRVQRPGRAAQDAAAFLRGHPVAAGILLGGVGGDRR